MLAKVLSHAKSQMTQANSAALLNFTKRGVYQAGQEPKVFVNKNTRVICQGITGKHVSKRKEFYFERYSFSWFPKANTKLSF